MSTATDKAIPTYGKVKKLHNSIEYASCNTEFFADNEIKLIVGNDANYGYSGTKTSGFKIINNSLYGIHVYISIFDENNACTSICLCSTFYVTNPNAGDIYTPSPMVTSAKAYIDMTPLGDSTVIKGISENITNDDNSITFGIIKKYGKGDRRFCDKRFLRPGRGVRK